MQYFIASLTAKVDEWMKQSIKGNPNTGFTSVATDLETKAYFPH